MTSGACDGPAGHQGPGGPEILDHVRRCPGRPPTGHRRSWSGQHGQRPHPGRQAAAAAVGIEATVVREIDGDTLEARRADGVTGRVRLVGINSPELAHEGQPAQPGAEMARDLLRPLRGRTIRIAHDASQETDKYDRALAYARHDGLDVGAEQIAAGAAREYTNGSSRLYEQRSEYVRPGELRPREGQGAVGL